jgi:hypothetical protein
MLQRSDLPLQNPEKLAEAERLIDFLIESTTKLFVITPAVGSSYFHDNDSGESQPK